MAKRVDIPKSNLHKRRRRRRIIAASIVAGFLLAVLGVVVGVTWLPFLRIHSVHVTGQKTVSGADVMQSAEAELSGGYLHLFAKSNIFLYPKGFIHDKLLQQFPILESVQVHAESFQTLGITVIEREPSALWCGVAVASTSGCYLMDKAGIVYAPAVVYSGDAYQKYYGAVDGDSVPQQYLSKESFGVLSELINVIQKKVSAHIQSVSVNSDEDVRLQFDSGFTLIFTLQAKAVDILDHLQLALMSDAFQTHAISEFDYLDLRFGDKLYYKLILQPAVAPVPTTKR